MQFQLLLITCVRTTSWISKLWNCICKQIVQRWHTDLKIILIIFGSHVLKEIPAESFRIIRHHTPCDNLSTYVGQFQTIWCLTRHGWGQGCTFTTCGLFSLANFHTIFSSKRLCCVFCYKNAVNQGFWSKTAVSTKQLFLAFLHQKCIFRWFMVNLLVLSEIISFVKKVQKGKILSTTIKGNCAQIRELKGRLWQRRPSSYKSYAALHSKVHSEFFWEIWILHFIAACSERLLERTK